MTRLESHSIPSPGRPRRNGIGLTRRGLATGAALTTITSGGVGFLIGNAQGENTARPGCEVVAGQGDSVDLIEGRMHAGGHTHSIFMPGGELRTSDNTPNYYVNGSE